VDATTWNNDSVSTKILMLMASATKTAGESAQERPPDVPVVFRERVLELGELTAEIPTLFLVHLQRTRAASPTEPLVVRISVEGPLAPFICFQRENANWDVPYAQQNALFHELNLTETFQVPKTAETEPLPVIVQVKPELVRQAGFSFQRVHGLINLTSVPDGTLLCSLPVNGRVIRSLLTFTLDSRPDATAPLQRDTGGEERATGAASPRTPTDNNSGRMDQSSGDLRHAATPVNAKATQGIESGPSVEKTLLLEVPVSQTTTAKDVLLWNQSELATQFSLQIQPKSGSLTCTDLESGVPLGPGPHRIGGLQYRRLRFALEATECGRFQYTVRCLNWRNPENQALLSIHCLCGIQKPATLAVFRLAEQPASVAIDELDFGDVYAGSTVARDLVVQNCATDATILISMDQELAARWSIVPVAPVEVPAKEARPIRIVYQPPLRSQAVIAAVDGRFVERRFPLVFWVMLRTSEVPERTRAQRVAMESEATTPGSPSEVLEHVFPGPAGYTDDTGLLGSDRVCGTSTGSAASRVAASRFPLGDEQQEPLIDSAVSAPDAGLQSAPERASLHALSASERTMYEQQQHQQGNGAELRSDLLDGSACAPSTVPAGAAAWMPAANTSSATSGEEVVPFRSLSGRDALDDGEVLAQRKILYGRARVSESLVRVHPTEIHLGDCYVESTVTTSVQVVNLADLPAFLSVRFSSTSLRVASLEPIIGPRQIYDLRIDFTPHRVNPDYSKQLTILNLRNPRDEHVVVIRANCVDRFRVLYHALFYRLATERSTQVNELDYGNVVAGHAYIRAFQVRNLTDKRLVLGFTCPARPHVELLADPRFERAQPHPSISEKDASEQQRQPATLPTEACLPHAALADAEAAAPAPAAHVVADGVQLQCSARTSGNEACTATEATEAAAPASRARTQWRNTGVETQSTEHTEEAMALPGTAAAADSTTTGTRLCTPVRHASAGEHSSDASRTGASQLLQPSRHHRRRYRHSVRLRQTVRRRRSQASSDSDEETLSETSDSNELGRNETSPVSLRAADIFAQLMRMPPAIPSFFSTAEAEAEFIRESLRPAQALVQACDAGLLRRIQQQQLEIEPNAEATLYVVIQFDAADRRLRTKLRPFEERLYLHLVDYDQSRLPLTPTRLHASSLPPRELVLRGRVCISRMEVAQPHINFGGIVAGEQRSKTLLLQNVSEMPAFYAVRKSGSVDSSYLHFGSDRRGVLRPFSAKEVPFVFRPSFHGAFEECVWIVNLLDPSDAHPVTMKALVHRRTHFVVRPLQLDFGSVSCAVAPGAGIRRSFQLQNCSDRRRVFVIEQDAADQRTTATVWLAVDALESSMSIRVQPGESRPAFLPGPGTEATETATPSESVVHSSVYDGESRAHETPDNERSACGGRVAEAALAESVAASMLPQAHEQEQALFAGAGAIPGSMQTSLDTNAAIEALEQKLRIAERKGRTEKVERLRAAIAQQRTHQLQDADSSTRTLTQGESVTELDAPEAHSMPPENVREASTCVSGMRPRAAPTASRRAATALHAGRLVVTLAPGQVARLAVSLTSVAGVRGRRQVSLRVFEQRNRDEQQCICCSMEVGDSDPAVPPTATSDDAPSNVVPEQDVMATRSSAHESACNDTVSSDWNGSPDSAGRWPAFAETVPVLPSTARRVERTGSSRLIQISPLVIAFGKVSLGQTVTSRLTIQNVSDRKVAFSVLEDTQVALPATLLWSPMRGTVDVHGVAQVRLSFRPDRMGTLSRTLVVTAWLQPATEALVGAPASRLVHATGRSGGNSGSGGGGWVGTSPASTAPVETVRVRVQGHVLPRRALYLPQLESSAVELSSIGVQREAAPSSEPLRASSTVLVWDWGDLALDPEQGGVCAVRSLTIVSRSDEPLMLQVRSNLAKQILLFTDAMRQTPFPRAVRVAPGATVTVHVGLAPRIPILELYAGVVRELVAGLLLRAWRPDPVQSEASLDAGCAQAALVDIATVKLKARAGFVYPVCLRSLVLVLGVTGPIAVTEADRGVRGRVADSVMESTDDVQDTQAFSTEENAIATIHYVQDTHAFPAEQRRGLRQRHPIRPAPELLALWPTATLQALVDLNGKQSISSGIADGVTGSGERRPGLSHLFQTAWFRFGARGRLQIRNLSNGLSLRLQLRYEERSVLHAFAGDDLGRSELGSEVTVDERRPDPAVPDDAPEDEDCEQQPSLVFAQQQITIAPQSQDVLTFEWRNCRRAALLEQRVRLENLAYSRRSYDLQLVFVHRVPAVQQDSRLSRLHLELNEPCLLRADTMGQVRPGNWHIRWINDDSPSSSSAAAAAAAAAITTIATPQGVSFRLYVDGFPEHWPWPHVACGSDSPPLSSSSATAAAEEEEEEARMLPNLTEPRLNGVFWEAVPAEVLRYQLVPSLLHERERDLLREGSLVERRALLVAQLAGRYLDSVPVSLRYGCARMALVTPTIDIGTIGYAQRNAPVVVHALLRNVGAVAARWRLPFSVLPPGVEAEPPGASPVPNEQQRPALETPHLEPSAIEHRFDGTRGNVSKDAPDAWHAASLEASWRPQATSSSPHPDAESETLVPPSASADVMTPPVAQDLRDAYASGTRMGVPPHEGASADVDRRGASASTSATAATSQLVPTQTRMSLLHEADASALEGQLEPGEQVWVPLVVRPAALSLGAGPFELLVTIENVWQPQEHLELRIVGQFSVRLIQESSPVLLNEQGHGTLAISIPEAARGDVQVTWQTSVVPTGPYRDLVLQDRASSATLRSLTLASGEKFELAVVATPKETEHERVAGCSVGGAEAAAAAPSLDLGIDSEPIAWIELALRRKQDAEAGPLERIPVYQGKRSLSMQQVMVPADTSDAPPPPPTTSMMMMMMKSDTRASSQSEAREASSRDDLQTRDDRVQQSPVPLAAAEEPHESRTDAAALEPVVVGERQAAAPRVGHPERLPLATSPQSDMTAATLATSSCTTGAAAQAGVEQEPVSASFSADASDAATAPGLHPKDTLSAPEQPMAAIDDSETHGDVFAAAAATTTCVDADETAPQRGPRTFGLHGCADIGEHLYELDAGVVPLGSQAIQRTIIIVQRPLQRCMPVSTSVDPESESEASSSTAEHVLEYKIHRVPTHWRRARPESTEWFALDRMGGILERTRPSQTICLTMKPESLGFFQEYLLFTDRQSPANLALLRVRMEVVAERADASTIFETSPREIDYGAVMLHHVYRNKSIRIRNLSDQPLEFLLRHDLDPQSRSELHFSTSNLALRKVTSVWVEKASSRRVFLYLRPEPESTETDQLCGCVVTRTFHLYVSCRLVRDFEECIEIRCACHAPELRVSTNDVSFTVPNLAWQPMPSMQLFIETLVPGVHHLYELRSSALFFAVTEVQPGTLSIEPRLSVVAEQAPSEKYIEEHCSIYNRRRPREFFWIRLRLHVGGGSGSGSAVPEFSAAPPRTRVYVLEQTVSRFLCQFAAFWAPYQRPRTPGAGTDSMHLAVTASERGAGDLVHRLRARQHGQDRDEREPLIVWLERVRRATGVVGGAAGATIAYAALLFEAHYCTDELVFYALRDQSDTVLQLALTCYSYIFKWDVFQVYIRDDETVAEALAPLVKFWYGQLRHFLSFFPDSDRVERHGVRMQGPLQALRQLAATEASPATASRR